jgi:hypothetical protein
MERQDKQEMAAFNEHNPNTGPLTKIPAENPIGLDKRERINGHSC